MILLTRCAFPAKNGKVQYYMASTEGLDELHWFAKNIGVPQAGFVDHFRVPHYMVYGYPYEKAIEYVGDLVEVVPLEFFKGEVWKKPKPTAKPV